jgi:effector-binding domain-containing protein
MSSPVSLSMQPPKWPKLTRQVLLAALVGVALALAPQAHAQGAPAQPPAVEPPSPNPAMPSDAPQTVFDMPESVELAARPALVYIGRSNWDDADKSLGAAFEAIFAAIGKAKLKSAGPPLVEYLESGENEFQFKAMIPVEQVPKTNPSKDVMIGFSPSGPVLKFVHRGSFEDLEDVYNRIDDYLAGKGLSMAKVFEEYETDPNTTPPDKMVTNIYIVTE